MPEHASDVVACEPSFQAPPQQPDWTVQFPTFGDSAISNVMCIYLGQYYPASPTKPDVIYDH